MEREGSHGRLELLRELFGLDEAAGVEPAESVPVAEPRRAEGGSRRRRA
jgi:hypothetical protein